MDIFSATKKQLIEFLKKEGEQPFRATQIYEWLFQKKAASFDEMSNLSKGLRELLKKNFSFSTINFKDVVSSKDGETYKYLWTLQDGYQIESVLILSGERRTLCISSQVGCKGGCLFCASGKEGFIRNLKTAEIVEQVVNIDKILNEKEKRISNVVFMGMGEPLDNLESVMPSIYILNDREGLNISQRKITISTVGLIEKLSFLSAQVLDNESEDLKSLKVNLTLSLHAPNQTIREKLLPLAKKNNFKILIATMKQYYLKTKRDITFEYILIDGVNDEACHAKELARALLDNDDSLNHFTVNLIPYNNVLGVKLKRPLKEKIELFKNTLEKEGIKVFQRYTKGKDISAACGQLAFLNKYTGCD
jgi:23S rRNA (adenine2503-C2)-methyltransferase